MVEHNGVTYDEVVFNNVAHNVALDILDMGQEQALNNIEVNWLESTDEWVVNIGDDLIYDGLTEKQAEWLKIQLENKAIDEASRMMAEDK